MVEAQASDSEYTYSRRGRYAMECAMERDHVSGCLGCSVDPFAISERVLNSSSLVESMGPK